MYSLDDFPQLKPGIKIQLITSAISSLSAARNRGLVELMANIVAFPDDDCWYPDSFWHDACVALSTAKAPIIATHVGDPTNGLSYGGRPRNVQFPISARTIAGLPISVGLAIDATKVGIKSIYFDERFGAGAQWGSGEETELLARLFKSGHKIWYDGNLTVFHPVERDTASFSVKKSYKYGIGYGALSLRLIISGLAGHSVELARIIILSGAGILAHLICCRWHRAAVSTARCIGIGNGMMSYARSCIRGGVR